MTPGKGSKYREFYDLSGRITYMVMPRKMPARIAQSVACLGLRLGVCRLVPGAAPVSSCQLLVKGLALTAG